MKLTRRCASFALVFFSAVRLLAADGLTSFDVAKLRNVGSAVIAPDGSRIAYTLVVPRGPTTETDGPAWVELHVLGRDGVSHPFVTGEVNVSAVRWTRDGRSISFLAKRGKDEFRGLYSISAEGGEAGRLISHTADIDAYSWSPDGKRVAFLAADESPKKRRELEKKGFNQQVYEESAPASRVWIASIGWQEAKPRLFSEVSGSGSEIEWAPTGGSLSVAIAPTSLIDDWYMRRKITVVDAESGKVAAKIDNPGKLGSIAWSPDGKSLAFLSAADLHDPSAGRLMVAPASGGAARDVLPGYEGNVAQIAWRDADTIVFLGAEGVQSAVGEVRRDGSARRTLLPAGGPVFFTLDLARDGSVVLVGQSPEHLSEVFLWTQREGKPRRLTTSNPWLASKRLAPQEVVRFQAKDGLALEGLLIHPLDEKKGEKYPLILAVHGGPESHYSNGWLTSYADPGQIAAARGFGVFYPNYRGSTVRGVAFSKMGQGDPAGKEFDDLVDAVDHMIGTGLVDRAKVGITGGSYGGYATAWCSTKYSDRFAAGVMFVGISDLVSKAGTTDISQEKYLVHARHWPWEDWNRMLERSPITHAGQSHTPMLILGGKDDPRVHPSQSLAFYRYVKLSGKAPVRLVLYPGEGHGNRFSAHRLDYNLRMLQWFEHYLKGAGGQPPGYELEYEQGE